MIFAVYCSFILSAANVFLMQACNKGNIKILLKQLVLSVFSLSAIGFAIFYFFADKILLFFGREFQKCCAPVLRILFMSIFSFAINQVYFGVLNLYNNIRQMAIISIAMLLAMAIALVVFLPALGVLAIAYAWVIANIIGNFCVILMNKRFIGITAAGDVCLLD
jgi:Na+-driven multidrug efflux pump